MKPYGVGRGSYAIRGVILAILLVAAAGYWHKWFQGTFGIWPAIVATAACALLVLMAERKHYLLILGVRMLGAFALMGVLRTLVTDEPILPAVIVLVVTGLILVLIRGHENTYWLFEDGPSESERPVELDLRSASQRDNKRVGG